MLELQTRLSAEEGRPRTAAIACALENEEKTAARDNASGGWSRWMATTPPLSSSISFGIALLMAMACGLAAANIYYDQPVLGMMGAALAVLAAQLVKIPQAAREFEKQEKTLAMDSASHDRSWPIGGDPLPSSISYGLTLVMAIACGVAAANIYYNQPMLGIMEAAFPSQVVVTELVPTATQLGFAAGLLLLVPLGDRFERRRLILIQFAALALSLAAAALAPDAWSLVVASALVGVTSSVAQQIVPFAAELAEPGRRGATIGTVMSGLLCGILFGRALAGAVGDHYGWRAMFWLGLLLAVAVGLLLAAALPRTQPRTQQSYGTLLKSLAVLWREERELRRATIIQGCLFGSFSVLWTILALQLDARYHLSAEIAGLFGIVGAVGVLFAPVAGKIADRRGPHAVIGLGSVIMLASWAVFEMWGMIAGLIVGVILLDFGEQGALVSNQHVIYALRPEARNRLNTIFMGGMFVGGAVGSAGASFAWQFAGWIAVCTFGAALVAIALALHACGRVAEKRLG
jgi:predicted MFS family arabinose efflux permease